MKIFDIETKLIQEIKNLFPILEDPDSRISVYVQMKESGNPWDSISSSEWKLKFKESMTYSRVMTSKVVLDKNLSYSYNKEQIGKILADLTEIVKEGLVKREEKNLVIAKIPKDLPKGLYILVEDGKFKINQMPLLNEAQMLEVVNLIKNFSL